MVRKLALLALLAVPLAAPAAPVLVSYDDITYEVSLATPTSYLQSPSLFEAQPWWDDLDAAIHFAGIVQDQLGTTIWREVFTGAQFVFGPLGPPYTDLQPQLAGHLTVLAWADSLADGPDDLRVSWFFLQGADAADTYAEQWPLLAVATAVDDPEEPTPTPVPEPATLPMLAGMLGVLLWRRRCARHAWVGTARR